VWAQQWGVPITPTLQILEALDINSRRLVCQFEQQA